MTWFLTEDVLAMWKSKRGHQAASIEVRVDKRVCGMYLFPLCILIHGCRSAVGDVARVSPRPPRMAAMLH